MCNVSSVRLRRGRGGGRAAGHVVFVVLSIVMEETAHCSEVTGIKEKNNNNYVNNYIAI